MLPNKKINVHLETEDGFVFTGQAFATQININSGLAAGIDLEGSKYQLQGPTTWELELVGAGEPLWVKAKDEFIEDLHSTAEWRCPWCGAIQLRETRQCSQCGGWRSFVYDLMD